MPLNILVDARPLVDPLGGGVRRVTRELLKALIAADEDLHFTFVTTGAVRPALPEPFKDHPAVTHVHIPLPNKLWSALCFSGVTALNREVARQTKKIYHAALLPNLGFVGRLTIPYALVLHDLSFLIEPRWYAPKMRLWHRAVNAAGQIRRANRLFCVSETTARDAERLLGISRDRIETFHPGIPTLDPVRASSQLDPVRARHALPVQESKKPFVLAFNESNPRKNIITAIAAVANLREDEEFAGLGLIIVGGAKKFRPLGSPSLRSGSLGAGHSSFVIRHSDWIIRLNEVSDDELSALYKRASALLYPSWYEGFGLPLHEAARFGTPCLASAHGALPETAPQGTLLIPPAKPQLWTSALRDVLLNPELHRTVSDPTDERPRVEGLIDWVRSMSAMV